MITRGAFAGRETAIQILGSLIFILAAWRWADWKHWERYHTTILYKISMSLLYDVLTYNYPLWVFSDFFVPTHTINALIVTFIAFTCTVLLFLSHYPSSIGKQVLYIAFWVLFNCGIELSYHLMGLFHYDNGWNFGWSIAFNCMMFPMLILHHKKPLIAYVLSIPIIIILLLIFDVPLDRMK
ncbi:CBO0543 family protein [Neobacillus mesonae]|uniref:CBO0543 family protein n=1 Tax=Neobacillus mesonae TaxID=1193713 RepID=UPI00203EB409|nr:CBO0543 family protein [Neobacillus mesonae]MCM3567248.1 hypothetical protein [Neobacillus mesonae]